MGNLPWAASNSSHVTVIFRRRCGLHALPLRPHVTAAACRVGASGPVPHGTPERLHAADRGAGKVSCARKNRGDGRRGVRD